VLLEGEVLRGGQGLSRNSPMQCKPIDNRKAAIRQLHVLTMLGMVYS
jgi:hypothetical protein